MAARKKTGGPADRSTQILIQIRDELQRMREEQRATNDRLEHLEARQREDAVRLATELVAVGRAVGEVRDLLRDQRADRGRLDDHERRITAIEKRVG